MTAIDPRTRPTAQIFTDLTRTQTKQLLAERHEDIMAHHDCAFAEEMLDIMIAHGVADHAEIDRLEGEVAVRDQEIAVLRQFVPVNEKLLSENGKLLALCDQLRAAAESPRWVPWMIVLACCVALYVRGGV